LLSLWAFSAEILGALYVLGFGPYIYGVIKRSLIKMLTGIIACTVCAFSAQEYWSLCCFYIDISGNRYVVNLN